MMEKVEEFEKGRFEEEIRRIKIKRGKDKVKSRGRRVQKRGVTRKIYSKVVIWMGR